MAERVAVKCLAQRRLRKRVQIERKGLYQATAPRGILTINEISRIKPAVGIEGTPVSLRVGLATGNEVHTVISAVAVHPPRIPVLPGRNHVGVAVAGIVVETFAQFGIGPRSRGCWLERHYVALVG